MKQPLCLLLAAAGVSSACGRAQSAPEPKSALRAVVISDLNAAYGSTDYPAEVGRAVDHIIHTWRPDVVLIAGDMVAGQSPQLSDSAVWAMWEEFDAVVAAPLRAAGIPLVATLGNHDASAYPSHARDRRIAIEYWRASPRTVDLPVVEREHYPLRYTVSYPDVFIAAWDATNQESSTDREILRWLREALASPEAREARHRIVLGHLPLYAVAEGRDRPGEVLAQGDMLRRHLEDWGATLFVSGHHHAYYPGRRGTLELLHAGALGNGPRQLLGSRTPARKTVSLLVFSADSLGITTYAIDAGTGALQPIPLRSLPPAICSSDGWVARRDLVLADTTCADPARTEMVGGLRDQH